MLKVTFHKPSILFAEKLKDIVMEKEIDLNKPIKCKRCGHTLPNIVEYKNILGDTYYFVECVVCKARTKGCATETMAKQMWQDGNISKGI